MTDSLESSESLTSFFGFSRASTPEQCSQVYGIRYAVYCREFGYERPEDCQGEEETDPYDRNAHHCLLQHLDSGQPAGCVRLVAPDDPFCEGRLLLPVERRFADCLAAGRFHPASFPREQICEISRLAVLSAFRRRRGEEKSPLGDPEGLVFRPEEIRAFPLLAVGLFLAATALVGMERRYHVFAMMEPRLARLLARSGLEFQQIGAITDFRGQRAPFYIDQRVAERRMVPPLKRLYHDICEQLSQGGRSATARRA